MSIKNGQTIHEMLSEFKSIDPKAEVIGLMIPVLQDGDLDDEEPGPPSKRSRGKGPIIKTEEDQTVRKELFKKSLVSKDLAVLRNSDFNDLPNDSLPETPFVLRQKTPLDDPSNALSDALSDASSKSSLSEIEDLDIEATPIITRGKAKRGKGGRGRGN